ncbi:MAG: efflux RND transporter periplasmic adaptor subunit [Thermoanaerobaculia bacterium]|nr:MAG: efflux RND transporter periplasmic adaptor subunit [Thermoanaerobaculia bacterium]
MHRCSPSRARRWATRTRTCSLPRRGRRPAGRAGALLAARVTSQRAVEEAEGELAVAEAEVEAARARVRAYGIDPATPVEAGRVVLASPIRGSVVTRSAHIGQWIEPGDAVLEVVDLDELWLLGAIFERDLRHARAGQRAEIEVRALPGERFSGEVAHVGQTLAHGDRTAALRVVLANPGHRLRPGMFATARLEAPAAGPQVLAVPAAAVQELDERHFVFVPAGEGVFDVRSVRLGTREADWVEVIEGLAAGEQVVASGGLLLRGQLLRSTLGEEEGEE